MILFKQAVTADATYSFANQANCVVFDGHNDTPFNMGISFGRDTGPDNADYYASPHSILTGIGPVGNAPSIGGVKWNGTIYVYTETPLGTGTTDLNSAPAFQVTIIGYPAGFAPKGTTSLSRMTSTPNTVSTNAMTVLANAISNLSSAPGTNIIAVQPSDAASETIQADNSGNFTVKGDNAGTLTTLLQLIAGASPGVKLAAAAVLTEILGNLKVDGTLESTGAATLDSTLAVTGAATFTGDATFNGVGTGVSIAHNISVAGTTSLDNGAATTDGSGNWSAGTYNSNIIGKSSDLAGMAIGLTASGCIEQSSGHLWTKGVGNQGFGYQEPAGSNKWTLHVWNGNGNATCGSGTVISHGLGTTPSIVLLTPRISQPGSATCGSCTWGASTFQATVGSGSAVTWLALVF